MSVLSGHFKIPFEVQLVYNVVLVICLLNCRRFVSSADQSLNLTIKLITMKNLRNQTS